MNVPAGPGEDIPLSLYDYERLAHAKIPYGAWERISSGAADEITLRWNREA